MDACNKLGEFTITGVERARKGEPKVCICSPFAGFILLHDLLGISIIKVLFVESNIDGGHYRWR